MLLHTLLELVEHLDQLPHDRAVILSLHGAPDQRRMEPKRRPELHEMVRKSTERVLLERGQGRGPSRLAGSDVAVPAKTPARVEVV
jgi:hypothetical protein